MTCPSAHVDIAIHNIHIKNYLFLKYCSASSWTIITDIFIYELYPHTCLTLWWSCNISIFGCIFCYLRQSELNDISILPDIWHRMNVYIIYNLGFHLMCSRNSQLPVIGRWPSIVQILVGMTHIQGHMELFGTPQAELAISRFCCWWYWLLLGYCLWSISAFYK